MGLDEINRRSRCSPVLKLRNSGETYARFAPVFPGEISTGGQVAKITSAWPLPSRSATAGLAPKRKPLPGMVKGQLCFAVLSSHHACSVTS